MNETERARGDDTADRIDRFGWVAVGITVAGSVGPWIRVPLFGSVSGLDGDGVLYVVVAALVGAGIWFKWSARATGILAVLSGLFVAGNSVRIIGETADEPLAVLAWGIYGCVLGGLGLCGVGIAYLTAWTQDEDSPVDVPAES